LTEAQLPVPTATSVALAGGVVDGTALVTAVLDALGGWYTRWLSGAGLRAEYAARCSSVGRPVRVQTSATAFVEGEATGVDAEGRLLVRVRGEERPFAAGDVVHLR
ncbi:MAG: biotin--[acetyl-CoA-carboxylase] ligase, partial [Propionibacteriaceae bacterium]|nr:biotin--[acetyl-CoA-carboxylase] ligase [Propionibacteriaceae bacterium]